VMVRSKEGCAVGRGGARRRFLFIFRIETNKLICNPNPSIPT